MLVALALYITVTYRHVKSRRFPACLFNQVFNYSGKRPSVEKVENSRTRKKQEDSWNVFLILLPVFSAVNRRYM